MSAARAQRAQLIRKFVAGLAAYALALQLLLPSFALAQIVSQAPLHDVLCASEATADKQGPAPVEHQQICPCGPLYAMHEFGASAGPVPANDTIAWASVATAYAYPQHLVSDRLEDELAFTPHNPRAPPVA